MRAVRDERAGGEHGERGVGPVVAFFHSPVVLAREQRGLFERGLPASGHAEHVRRASAVARANLARIFVAARVASHHRAPLLFVEGWRAQAVERVDKGTRHMTGSRMAHLLLRMLQRRRLADPALRVLRRDASRCTEEEVAAVQEDAAFLGASRVIGIAGRACPSRRRAARYFRLQGRHDACVLDGWRQLAAWRSTMTPNERAFAAALAQSASERLQGTLVEGASWLVHFASRAETLLRQPSTALEIRLARRLRRDRP
jgi:hypothetical protein